MSKRLIIYIDESWPNRPSAPWVLLDSGDHVLAQGESEPNHWPAATDTHVVLAGPQCSRIKVRLPRCSRRDEHRLMRYALEDQLIRDVENEHITVADREPVEDGTACSVLVTARSRLRHVVSQLQAIGWAPTLVVSELDIVHDHGDDWTIHVGPRGDWILHVGDGTTVCMDETSAERIIEHLLRLPRGEVPSPGSLTSRSAPGVTPDKAGMPDSILGLEVRQGVIAYHWWEGLGKCSDLLHGEFAPVYARSGVLGAVRKPFALGVAAFAVFLTATIMEVLWQQHRLGSLEDRMRRIFETSVPNTPAISPALQLQRALDDTRAQHGQLRADDFLNLLDHFSAAASAEARGSVVALEYEDGRLNVTLTPSASTALPLLETRLQGLGLEARTAPGPVLVLEYRRLP